MTPVARGPRPFSGAEKLDLDGAYRHHRVRLFNYFRRCGLHREASEDLAQGVFLVLMENPRKVFRLAKNIETCSFAMRVRIRTRWRVRWRTCSEAPD